MFEEKESLWKKKGFYLSVCTALICVLAIGTVYYKMNYQNDNNGKNLFADSATEAPDTASDAVGGSAIKNNEKTNDKADSVKTEDNNSDKNVSVAAANNTADSISSKNALDKEETADERSDSNKKTSNSSKENSATNKAANTNKASNDEKKESDSNVAATMSGAGNNSKFDMEKGLLWPVSGDIILKYSMSNTVYFKTLAQYKCNPAIAIAAKEGQNVKSAADGTVTNITKTDELGNIITVDIGSGYQVTYGQLKDISVKKGQTLKEGDVIGKIAKPTKYYSEEGTNLYFQVMENDKSVDPLLLLR